MKHVVGSPLGLALVTGAALLVAAGRMPIDSRRLGHRRTPGHAGSGHAYVGVQAAGQWAPPQTRSCVRFYSAWNHQATIFTNPIRDEWFVFVHTCSGSVVNVLNPMMVLTSRTSPGIGISRAASGFLSLDLGVSVDPASAPAGTVRTVSAALTGDWLNSIGDAISAYVIADSVRVRSWTVDFGDGTVRTYPADATLPDRLVATHAYGAGAFEATVTAHVTGDAYGAFFTPAGIPFEQVVPFSIDISNSASGIAGLPIVYVPPVVTVGGSPSGSTPDGPTVAPTDVGLPAFAWPRGLACALYVRPIIVTEGSMTLGWRPHRRGHDTPRRIPVRGGRRTTPRTRRAPASTTPRPRSRSSGTRRCRALGRTRSVWCSTF